jgi:hypothetical protein
VEDTFNIVNSVNTTKAWIIPAQAELGRARLTVPVVWILSSNFIEPCKAQYFNTTITQKCFKENCAKKFDGALKNQDWTFSLSIQRLKSGSNFELKPNNQALV